MEAGGRILVVRGDAGVGKTALLSAAADLAEVRGIRVLSARAGLLEHSEGFGVVRQLLERVVNGAVGDDASGLLNGAAALALGVFGHGDAVLDDQARYGLYWLIANLVETGPLVMILDDAQWADIASLNWLLYLGRRLADLPLTVILGVRDSEPEMPETIGLIEAEPAADRIVLAPLTAAETAQLIQAAWPGADDAAFAEACHGWTGGNPHYVAEVLAALEAEGLEPGPTAADWMQNQPPERLATLTLTRLRRLSPAAVALAEAVAVLGEHARLDRASALARLSEADATAAADALAGARILRPAAAVLGFVHPLVAAIVLAERPAAQRSADHRRAADLMLGDGAGTEKVASQLLATHPAGDRWVVDWLLGAAGEALGHGAAASAVELLTRALAEPPAPDQAATVLGTLGMAEAITGNPLGISRLVTSCAQADDPAQRAGLTLICARFQIIAGQIGEAVSQLQRALDGLDPDAADVRLALETMLITAARSDPDLRGLADRHLAAIRSVGDSDTPAGRLVAAHVAFAQVCAGEPVPDAVASARHALGGGRLLDENPLSPDGYIVPMSMLAICGELEEAAGWYARAADRVRGRGDALSYAAVAALASWTAFLRGRLDEADLLCRDALRLSAGTPALAVLEAFATAHLAAVLCERDEPAAALELLDAALEGEVAAAALSDLLMARGHALLALERPADALEAFRACGENQERAGVRNPAFLPWRSGVGLSLHRLSRGAEALATVDAELTLAEAFGADRPIGVTLRIRGLISGEVADLSTSVDRLAGSGARLELAASQIALGAALRRGGDRAAARRPLAEGLANAEACGGTALARRARTELQASGARRRSGGSFDPDALTVAERRVAEMAATGMRNREIAQALFVTRGTVESQLHVAYRKLGISSRTQLAAALGELTVS